MPLAHRCADAVYTAPQVMVVQHTHGRMLMAKILYSMAGEGRGHAVRLSTLVEHLRGVITR